MNVGKVKGVHRNRSSLFSLVSALLDRGVYVCIYVILSAFNDRSAKIALNFIFQAIELLLCCSCQW